MDSERQFFNQVRPFSMFTRVIRRVFTLCICYKTNINFEGSEYQMISKSDDNDSGNRATDKKDTETPNIEIITPIRKKDYVNIHKFDHVFRKKAEEEYNKTDNDILRSKDADVTEDKNEEYPVIDTKEIRHIISNRILPVTPGMKCLQQRLNSFRNNAWPLHGIHNAKCMAEAGFFCVGIREQAECHFCSLRIYTWVDPPSVEHVRLSPWCRFLRDTHSDEWINNILFQRDVGEVSCGKLIGDNTSSDIEKPAGSDGMDTNSDVEDTSSDMTSD